MKIGILSDSHDNLPAVAAAVEVFNEAGVSLVLHAGDLVAPFVSRPLKELKAPFTAIFGNNDGDRLFLSRTFEGQIHKGPLALTHEGKRILLMHEPDNLDALADSGHFDAIIYGHTHDVDVREGKTLVVNPGECGGWVREKCTAALWDLESGGVEIVDLSPA